MPATPTFDYQVSRSGFTNICCSDMQINWIAGLRRIRNWSIVSDASLNWKCRYATAATRGRSRYDLTIIIWRCSRQSIIETADEEKSRIDFSFFFVQDEWDPYFLDISRTERVLHFVEYCKTRPCGVRYWFNVYCRHRFEQISFCHGSSEQVLLYESPQSKILPHAPSTMWSLRWAPPPIALAGRRAVDL